MIINITILSLVIVFTATAQAFARIGTSTNVNGFNISIVPTGSSSYNLSINGTECSVQYEEQKKITKTEVTDLDTGEEYYFIRDNVNNTIYSSLTDTTIPIEQQANAGLSSQYKLQRASASDKFIGTKTISTKKILMGVTAAAELIKIATCSLSYFGLIGAAVKLIANSWIFRIRSMYYSCILDHYGYTDLSIRTKRKNCFKKHFNCLRHICFLMVYVIGKI